IRVHYEMLWITMKRAVFLRGYGLFPIKKKFVILWYWCYDNKVAVNHKESTHDRVAASRASAWLHQENIGREVRNMTAFEIISIFIGILTLLVTFGSLIVAFLAFLTRDKDNKKK
ncbi:MAG: putative holin-like toxin, partial [Ruminococcus sp.]|nr:putative holin-like toxin [Ruminococcus sp.]